MKIIVTENFDKTCERAAGIIGDVIHNKPDARLGLATGSTAQGVYPYLIAANCAGKLDFSRVNTINLDEYVGLAPDHPQSYRRFMDENLFNHINIDKKNTFVANGTGDFDANVAEFRKVLAEKPIDIQVLGIGVDGHVGFNEPGSSLASGTRVKTLAEQTRVDNARFFDNDINQVPTHCITQGIGTIMKARHLVLLAFGAGKAEAVAETVEGGISSFCPASALQMHPHATIIVDEEAASRLRNKDYYRYSFEHKPAWQAI